MSFIEFKNIEKEYKTFQRKKGIGSAIQSLFYREYEIKKAVDDISFNIEKGELVGYIGPNGAGKSTTIKILSGILLPSQGEVNVNGITPYKNRKKNAMQIGVVFGQRSQLNWDLPMEDTFELYKRMYKVSNGDYKKNVTLFVELLEMQDFLRKPVRQLSLGQKMRAEIAISLLHNPEILYLDEPTIGLDVVAKKRIRTFIKALNKEKDTTVILTTHDMADIEQICNRIIMIDEGKKIYDDALSKFKDSYCEEYVISVEFATNVEGVFNNRFTLINHYGNKKYFLFNKNHISVKEAIMYFSQQFDIIDISIQGNEIEEVVRKIYESSGKKNVV
ncbi:ABC-2 type transport system ATP-binding protein [Natranaerovirga hydrolytica]|uniref:ABC-2 type transport system ATP-binding protein n=1 Tax=Natranaerovirga hydrolytica TaxID=680378 RepID=A0A4R1MLL7_9FIRM|nr:ATP-binding cassette domain-containing protein [Natranaerovirga hydrolytica]TCK92752.1 ABC-2 type transport system ATP-binding protein [Natranaerovirga hydrolytica]